MSALDAILALARAIQHSLPGPVLLAVGCVALVAFAAYDYIRNSP